MTSMAHREMTVELTKGVVSRDHVLGEPAARNTAACIEYAAMEILKKYGDGVMVVAPSDHFIRDEAEYKRVFERAVELAEETDSLITVGIKPTYPCTGYGYIKNKESAGKDYREVVEFVEKPDPETAHEYLVSGE